MQKFVERSQFPGSYMQYICTLLKALFEVPRLYLITINQLLLQLLVTFIENVIDQSF